MVLVQFAMQQLGILTSFLSDCDMIIPSKKLKAMTEVIEQEWSPLSLRSWTLLETVFVDCHNVACSCAYSEQGYLPRTCFFRRELVTCMGSPLKTQAIAEVIRFLGKRRDPGLVKDLDDALAPTVLRICIFEHLELAHTCCWMDNRHYDWERAEQTEIRDDISYILDEQRSLIEQVEDQTTFFL